MTALSLIQLAVMLLKGVLSSLPGGAKYQVIADSVQNALAELAKVHDTPVTREQLEGLRTKPLW